MPPGLRFADAVGNQLSSGRDDTRVRRIIVAGVVISLGPYVRFIPKSVLAGLLFVTAARLIDWKRLGYGLRASRFDAVLVAVTSFTAVFVDVEDSILVGVALSILWFVLRASKLRCANG